VIHQPVPWNVPHPCDLPPIGISTVANRPHHDPNLHWAGTWLGDLA